MNKTGTTGARRKRAFDEVARLIGTGMIGLLACTPAVAGEAATSPGPVQEGQAEEVWAELHQLRGQEAREALAALGDELQPLLESSILDKAHDGTSQLRNFALRRIPAFTIPASRAEWDWRAEALRRDLLENVIYRGIPQEAIEGDPEVRWGQTIDTGKGYRIRKLAFEGYPGVWIPALLYEPTNLKGKVPAVLNPMGHFPAGKAEKFQQIRCINLAKRGMLALSPDWVGYGQLYVRGEVPHDEMAHLELSGVSGTGVLYLVAKRSLDVLLAHPHADAQRVAVTGVSGGGWQTIMLGALDQRVKLAAPNAGHVPLATHTLKNLAGDKEQNPCDLGRYADFIHLTALLFPRPALLIYNAKDPFIPCEPGRAIFEQVRPLYQKWGDAEDFQLHINEDPGTHNYERDNREAFYRFLNRHFVPEPQRVDEEIPSDSELLSADELAVKVDVPLLKGFAPWQTLAQHVQEGLPKSASSFEPGSDEWAAELRDKLRATLRVDRLNVEEASRQAIITDRWYRGEQVTFQVGDDWLVPAAELTPPQPRGTVICVTDWGRNPRYNPVPTFLVNGRQRVICLDLPFSGELNTEGHGTFRGWHHSQLTQVFDAVGKPPLGVRVSILLAMRDYLASQHADQPVTVYVKGPQASMVGLVATALAPDGGRLVLPSPPESLKQLTAKPTKYAGAATLFSFGLLEVADTPMLMRLAGPSIVDTRALMVR